MSKTTVRTRRLKDICCCGEFFITLGTHNKNRLRWEHCGTYSWGKRYLKAKGGYYFYFFAKNSRADLHVIDL